MPLELSAPNPITFLAVMAVIIHYTGLTIPHVHSGFVILLVGYLILAAGSVLGGLIRLRLMD